jgi:hypothetical protein
MLKHLRDKHGLPTNSEEEIDHYLADVVQPYDVCEPRSSNLRLFLSPAAPPASLTHANTEQTDILQWWRTQSPRFPWLSVMAADYWAAPATSIPSEEVFSPASDSSLITKKQNRMPPETAKARICARYWLEFPELTDEHWAEAKHKKQALLARLEEQDACWLAQSASAADGGIGGIGDIIGDSHGSEDGAGEGHGFSGGGSSGRGSRGAGSGGGAVGAGSGTGSGDESS